MNKIRFNTSNQIRFNTSNKIVGITQHVEGYIQSIDVDTGGARVDQGWFDDVRVDRVTTAGTGNDGQVVVTNIPLGNPIYMTNETPAICSLDETTGYLTYLSDGQARINVSSPGFGDTIFALQMYSSSYDYDDVAEYEAGSLAKHINDRMTTFINSGTGSDAIQNYVTQVTNNDPDNPDVTINPSLFTNGEPWDWTGISVLRSDQIDSRYPPALIEPRFALGSTHTNLYIGDRLVFKKSTNDYQTVTILDRQTVALDTVILYLSAAVTGVPTYKLMPQGWRTTKGAWSLRSTNHPSENGYSVSFGVPLFRFSMHKLDGYWGSSLQINPFSFNNTEDSVNYGSKNSCANSVSDYFCSFCISTRKGDSGSPAFLIVNDEPIYISTLWTTAGGDDFSTFIPEIEAAMDAMDGGTHTIATANLAAFNSY